jgi:hypothetical protein
LTSARKRSSCTSAWGGPVTAGLPGALPVPTAPVRRAPWRRLLRAATHTRLGWRGRCAGPHPQRGGVRRGVPWRASAAGSARSLCTGALAAPHGYDQGAVVARTAPRSVLVVLRSRPCEHCTARAWRCWATWPQCGAWLPTDVRRDGGCVSPFGPIASAYVVRVPRSRVGDGASVVQLGAGVAFVDGTMGQRVLCGAPPPPPHPPTHPPTHAHDPTPPGAQPGAS